MINQRPEPFSIYTAADLWTDPHTSKEMLKYHLNEELALASRTGNTITSTVAWMQSRFNINSNTTIADFGCGPGLYATRLAEKGAIVTGIDFSENSLKYGKSIAKEKGLNINYVHADYLDFETESLCLLKLFLQSLLYFSYH